MPPSDKRCFWQKIRRPFRWCRIALLSLVLIVLGCLIRFDTVGLPDFVKTRLIAVLRNRGLDLRLEALHLRWFRGLVADSVVISGPRSSGSATLVAREVVLKPDWMALARLRFDIRALLVRNGRLNLALSSTNSASDLFVVDQVQTQLRLLPDDHWELDRFEANCLGARLEVQASLANASAIQHWMTPSSTNRAGTAWQDALRETIRIAGQMHFSQPPRARLLIRGDAREPASVNADLSIDVRNADTAWGKFDNLLLTSRVNRQPPINNEVRSDLDLVVEKAEMPWVGTRASRLHVDWRRSPTNPMPVEMKWTWDLSDVTTPWGRIPDARFIGHTIRSADDPVRLTTDFSLDSGSLHSKMVDFETNHFSARMVHSPDGVIPLQMEWQWTAASPESRWGQARVFELSGNLTRSPANTPSQANSDWAWWSLLEPYSITWSARLGDVTLKNIALDEIQMNGRWLAPEVTIDAVHARLAGRNLNGSAGLNVGTRRLQAQCNIDFDLHLLFPLLEPGARQKAEPIRWTTPPKLTARASWILPAWTNSNPELQTELFPTLEASGTLDAGEIGFRNMSFNSMHSGFQLSNGVLRLPDLELKRPEGRVAIDFSSDLRDGRYSGRVESGIDPLALRSLFEDSDSPALSLFQFTGPPSIEGEVRGRWPTLDETGVIARVRATNFVFRGESFDELSASFQFTNNFLLATDVAIRSGNEKASGPGVGFDLATGMLFLTNAVGTMDPQRILRCINPLLATNLSYYTFKQPPEARVNGWIEVRHGRVSDLSFDLSGGPFNYWKFNVPRISGTVQLVNEQVTITNLVADFYGGKLAGAIVVASTATNNPDLHLAFELTDADLHQMMRDISSPTNRLEGILTGELTVTKANAGDWGSWNGFGSVRLRGGYLWDIPLFGIFSPVLNAIVPGLGQSRVSGGAAGFMITNSVIHTRDMTIHSPAMRLAYRGTIDFNYRVDARVEASLLHDVWVVGPLVSLVFSPLTKLLEYKVTGTLSDPKLEPLLIPKPLQFPLHPWRTLKELFGEEKPSNPPEEKKTPP